MSYLWIIIILLALLVAIVLFWPLKKRPFPFISSVLIFSIVVITLYYFLGGGHALQNYYAEQKKSEQVKNMLKTFKNSDEIIEAMKKAIAKNSKKSSEKAKGWYLLGRLYRTQKNTLEAVSAFQKAHDLKPENFTYAFEYLQSLYALNHQQHTLIIDKLIIQLKKQQPDNPELLDFLGYDAYIHEHYEVAIQYWEKLLPYLSGNPKARKAILQAIGKAEKKLVK